MFDDEVVVDDDDPKLLDVNDLLVVLDFGKLVVEFSFSPSISKPKF